MKAPLDILRRAKAAIDANTVDLPPALLRPLEDGAEGITIRPAPPTVTQTYMDGTQEVAYLIDVYVRNLSEATALEQAEAVSWALQVGDLTSLNGSYELGGVTEYSGATEVGQPSDGMHTFMVGVRANITVKP